MVSGYRERLDTDSALALDDSEVEDTILVHSRKVLRVLTAPGWKPAITTYESSMHNITFGCPYCKKGKVTLFR